MLPAEPVERPPPAAWRAMELGECQRAVADAEALVLRVSYGLHDVAGYEEPVEKGW